MGQYWKLVNIDKGEFLHPHALGTGLKLWEQLANHPGTGAALLILLTDLHGVGRGGGDFDLDENWHGPERTFPEHNISPGPMPEAYAEVAARTIGRWVGDRVVLIGDYAEPADLADLTDITQEPLDAQRIYRLCLDPQYAGELEPPLGRGERLFIDISEDVAKVIEHELGGKFEGDGWREFKREEVVGGR